MTLSLSLCFRSFVRSSVPFFSFSVPEVFSSPKEFQLCFKKVSRVFEVYRVFQVSFKEVLRVFTESLKGVQVSLERVSKFRFY